MIGDTCAVIAAGGMGLRFKNPHGKQYTPLLGHPLCFWALKACLEASSVGAAVIVCADERKEEMISRVVDAVMCESSDQSLSNKDIFFASAQSTRQASVYEGLLQVPRSYRYVAIHDGARPLLLPQTLDASLAILRAHPDVSGCICATPVTDTVKKVARACHPHASTDTFISADTTGSDQETSALESSARPTILETVDRSQLFAAQTPQSFVLSDILAAHSHARSEAFVGTDDASLCERMGMNVAVFEAPRDNIKVTLPEDLAVARALLCARAQISKE